MAALHQEVRLSESSTCQAAFVLLMRSEAQQPVDELLRMQLPFRQEGCKAQLKLSPVPCTAPDPVASTSIAFARRARLQIVLVARIIPITSRTCTRPDNRSTPAVLRRNRRFSSVCLL